MFKNGFKIIALVACLFYAGSALAVTQTVAAHIAFAAPLSITQESDINFGSVKVDEAGVYSARDKARIMLAGAADQIINIAVKGFAADKGVNLQNATCAYDGADMGPCAINGAAPGKGKALLLDVQAVADRRREDAMANPALDVVVVYQ